MGSRVDSFKNKENIINFNHKQTCRKNNTQVGFFLVKLFGCVQLLWLNRVISAWKGKVGYAGLKDVYKRNGSTNSPSYF